jgi:hypothetical protein
MAQANFPSITTRGYDEARMHADLVNAIASLRPARIVGVADRYDLEDRAAHLRAILATAGNYVKSIVRDTVDSMSAGAGCIDHEGIAAILADGAADICAQLLNARDAIIEARDAA